MTVAWLQDLEEKVRQAVAELGALREQNDSLKQRIAELEQQTEVTNEWETERDDIRQRVEELTSSLENLLSE